MLQQTSLEAPAPPSPLRFCSPTHSCLFDITAKSEGAFLQSREARTEGSRKEELSQKDEAVLSVCSFANDHSAHKEDVGSGSTEEPLSMPDNSVHFEADGSVYEGQWQSNMKHGKGRELHNGNCYEGAFECGRY